MSKTIEELLTEFRESGDDFESAHVRADIAKGEETTALNRLNAAQKALDEWFDKTRENGPWNSNWHQQRKKNKHVASV